MKSFTKILTLLLLLQLFPVQAFAQQAADPNFDPGFLISDEAFGDTATFGSAAGVQQFLESRGSVLANTDASFLTKLREPAASSWKQGLEDPRPSLGRLRTAAELIYDAATSAGLNPQVLLVTLQKEQSLITKNFTDPADLQRALDRSLGYGCPDGSPCQVSFLGFYNQLFGTFDAAGDRWIGAAKSLAKSFTYEVGGIRVGRGPLVDALNQAFGTGPFVKMGRKGNTIIFQNTLGGFAGVAAQQTVSVKNYATAALYRYTPHVFNGNYNFWRFFQEWFKYPNGTVIKLINDSTLWVIDNGQRRTFSLFVAQQRGINTSSPITVSPTELNNYIEGARYIPKDGTIIKSDADGTVYLIEEGKRRKVTAFTAGQRSLNLSTAVALPHAEVSSYELGSILLPLEGTLIRGEGDPTVFVMSAGEKRPLTLTVFQQRKFSFADVKLIPRAEVDEIPAGALMPPPDGLLIKSAVSPAVYIIENGTKRILSYNVFVQRNFSFSSVIVLSEVEMSALAEGLPLPPLNDTLVKTADHPAVFLVRQGSKVFISGSMFLMHGFNRRPLMIVSRDEIDALPQATFALAPPESTLIRAEGEPTVYLVEKGQLRPLTFEAFTNRRFRFSNVRVLEPGEVVILEKGEAIIK